VTDDELTDAWGAVLGWALTHDEHLRIAYVLIQRHGKQEARQRLLAGTEANCAAMDAADRFDSDLTERWSDHLADLVAAEEPSSFAAMQEQHPELTQSDLLGRPSWKRT
jgi:hypothetical protein